MGLVYTAILGLVSLAIFIIFIIVLIKSFKEGGVLHGILGIITCGLYTYIWGWIKGKELQLFKMMLLWTILWVLSIAIPVFVGTAEVLKAIPMLNEMGLQSQAQKKDMPFKKYKKTAGKKAKKQKQARQKAKKSSPKKPADWNSQAVALWKNGKYTNPQKAVNLLDKAIKQNPKFVQAYNNRGNAYRDLKQHQKALNDYDKAISLSPEFVKAYSNRGNIYYDQKKYQMAIKDYNKTISLNPSYRMAYLNRGLAYHQLKKNNLACTDLKKACQLGDCDGINWAKQRGICK